MGMEKVLMASAVAGCAVSLPFLAFTQVASLYFLAPLAVAFSAAAAAAAAARTGTSQPTLPFSSFLPIPFASNECGGPIVCAVCCVVRPQPANGGEEANVQRRGAGLGADKAEAAVTTAGGRAAIFERELTIV